jgi:hypothetical protein
MNEKPRSQRSGTFLTTTLRKNKTSSAQVRSNAEKKRLTTRQLLAFAILGFAFVLLFLPRSRDFLAATASHFVASMTGLVSLGIALYEQVKGKSDERLFYLIAAMCFFFAGFQAWEDEHTKVLAQITYITPNFNPFGHPNSSLPLFQAGATPFVNMNVVNEGSYPAEHEYAVKALEIHDLESRFDPFVVTETNPTTQQMEDDVWKQFLNDTRRRSHGDNTKLPHEPYWISIVGTHPLSNGEVEGLRSGTKLAFLVGFFKWQDGGGIHEWRFMYYIKPPADSQIVMGICDTHNGFLKVAED